MTIRCGRFFHITIVITLLLTSGLALAADSATTFESFYRADASMSWLVNGIAALVIGGLVIFGLPILGPGMVAFISSIGTTVGGVFGFTGIAATNFGLALLGGGAIASGGFGMLGGTALLAAALTFGTDVTLDYAIGAAVQRYDAGKFAEASLKMMTLPLPINSSGSDSVKLAVKALKTDVTGDSWHCVKQYPNSVASFKACLAASEKSQRQRVNTALTVMRVNRKSTQKEELEREAAMVGLLHFLNNDYSKAQAASLRSYKLAIKNKSAPTLPAFIYAASLLYVESPNLDESFNKFQYAVIAEPKNAMTPVLFAAYLDRLSFRLNDRGAGVDQIARLSSFAETLPHDPRKLAIQQTLLSHTLMQLKLAQQKVLSLTRTQNDAIRIRPSTLIEIRTSAADYSQLLSTAKALATRQDALLALLSRDKSWWDRVKSGENPMSDPAQALMDQGWPETLRKFQAALNGYEADQAALKQHVGMFEKELTDRRKAMEAALPASEPASNPIPN